MTKEACANIWLDRRRKLLRECTDKKGDGFDDLSLRFGNQAIVNALGSVNDGGVVQLTLTGNLNDGTPIEGKYCVITKSKGCRLSKSAAEGERLLAESYAFTQTTPTPSTPKPRSASSFRKSPVLY